MAPRDDAAGAPSNPARFGKYELIRRLGQGGMAEVYLARQAGAAGFAKQVVLKQVLPQHVEKANFRAMFLDEARLAALLSHPNICQVFDLGEADGRFYLAMEYVDGLTLSQVLAGLARRGLRMPLDATMRIIGGVLEALHAAHSLTDEAGQPLQVVHRDVTPSNIMVAAQGSVKLLDFGIARMRGRSTETRVGMAKGKLGYMAPEQLRSQPLDARTDVFQVGAVLYQLVVGRGPYAHSMGGPTIFDDMAATRFPAPRALDAAIPEALEAIILTAMRRHPDERYQSALELHGALEAFARAHQLSMGPQVVTSLVQSLSGEFQVVDDEVVAVGSADLLDAGTTTVRGQPERPAPRLPEAPRRPLETVSMGARPARSGRPSALALLAIAVTAVGVGLGGVLAWGMPRDVDGRGPAVLEPMPPALVPPALAAGAGRAVGEPPQAPVADAPPRPPAAATDLVERAGAAPVPKSARPPERSSPRPRAVAVPTPVDPFAMGELEVRCEPTATVRIAGRAVGTCPLTVALTEGMHRVVLEYPGLPPRTLMVSIMPGVTTPLFDRR
jgi:serine/threonine-protein kinase